MMYCSNCGKKLNADDFFCSNCGTPVLRQGLFDDNSEGSKDSFDETRLFSPEELGKLLEEDAQKTEKKDKKKPKVSAPKQSVVEPEPVEYKAAIQESLSEEIEAPQNDSAAKTAGASASAGAFAQRFKAKITEQKLAKAEQKQQKMAEKAQKMEEERLKKEAAAAAAVQEAVQVHADVYEEPAVDDYEEVIYDEGDDELIEKPVKPLSFKMVALPVIVFGIIIGLVLGLIVTQPWANDEAADTTNTGVIVSQVDTVE